MQFPRFRWNDLNPRSGVVLEGVALLGLMGFATPPDAWLRKIADRDMRVLLSVCCGLSTKGLRKYARWPLTKALMRLSDLSAMGRIEIFRTRYCPEENVHLYGMDLGEGSHS